MFGPKVLADRISNSLKLGLYTADIYNLWKSQVEKLFRGIKEGAKVKPKKNVGLAVILSSFVSGLGQLYNGQPLKALLFFLTGYTLLVP